MHIYIYMHIYIKRINNYIYIYIYTALSPNNRCFRVPGGVGSGLCSLSRAKICAREQALVDSRCLPLPSVASWSPVVTCGRLSFPYRFPLPLAYLFSSSVSFCLPQGG